MFFGNTVVSKFVGSNYEVILDRDGYTVSVQKGRERPHVYTFNKYYQAVNFYASLKKVKDVKEALMTAGSR